MTAPNTISGLLDAAAAAIDAGNRLTAIQAINYAADEPLAWGWSPVTLPVMVAFAEHLHIDLGPYEHDQGVSGSAVLRLIAMWDHGVAESRGRVARELRAAAAAERAREAA